MVFSLLPGVKPVLTPLLGQTVRVVVDRPLGWPMAARSRPALSDREIMKAVSSQEQYFDVRLVR